jgi:hypothetical protein
MSLKFVHQSHPLFGPVRVQEAPQNGPIFASFRAQLDYNQKAHYLPIIEKCSLHKLCDASKL